ncbi:NAD(P)H-dependent FMN reductase [Paucibacter oligotrophus]|uniref:NAD(P)H-dependent FMN reductase n=1 Tax=Roseateles oligotrophus TaxID=1769250 RepID=A0A840LAQ8_9BURK|nr:NAD(P)H-dependent oxidoreductase [Roseateles oligotrophus]MBB4843209.1 NAD(P)H-dependent FMN reductase [Roseateles oligotrophus]
MNILIISGSPRVGSNSEKVAKYLAGVLEGQSGVAADILQLHEGAPRPWTSSFWDANSNEAVEWKKLSTRLQSADGFVIVSPEYAGMAPPGLMNLILKCGIPETGHKPALLVGVSSGSGGVYPLAQLRQFGFKNNFLCMLPFSVIVRNANDALGGHEKSERSDAELSARLGHGCALLCAYAQALAQVRASEINFSKYPYGQ